MAVFSWASLYSVHSFITRFKFSNSAFELNETDRSNCFFVSFITCDCSKAYVVLLVRDKVQKG